MKTEIDMLIDDAEREFSVGRREITGAPQTVRVTTARNAVVYVARRTLGLSSTRIARALGNRDHTSVLHGEKRAVQMLQTPAFAESIKKLEILVVNRMNQS